MFSPRVLSCTSAIVASVSLAAAAALIGCSGAATSNAKVINVSGNWQLASVAPAASKLPSLSGELQGNSTSMTGIFHSDAKGACTATTQSFEVSGKADANQLVTLTANPFAGGTLTITGTLASDGKSLTNAQYMVTGGTCAFPTAAAATAQAYSSIDGTYTGSFADTDGLSIPVNATLTQTPASDADGNFQLSGTGTFPNNPCFSSPVSISASQVTGGSFDLTYSDPVTLNSVEAIGNFSTDGKTLTVTNWILTGSCGPDTGTGLLSQN